jgi:lipoprotein-anchoring transpeptidase ErfK/SrfK
LAASKQELRRFGWTARQPAIVVHPPTQTLALLRPSDSLPALFDISTGKAGIGTQAGSGKTPYGMHRISQMYGKGQPEGMIFKGRRPTGTIATIHTDSTDLPEDHVTTRVMWLTGLEEGVNKGPGHDSHSRYIYIHGTPEEGLIEQPASHGCIRMRNAAVVRLFRAVGTGTLVYIIPPAAPRG